VRGRKAVVPGLYFGFSAVRPAGSWAAENR
jgi:hypothetical protein